MGNVPLQEDAFVIGRAGSLIVEGERLAFENWIRGHCWKLEGEWNGKGYSGSSDLLWSAWCARAALSVPSSVPTEEAARAMGASGSPVIEEERLAFESWMKGFGMELSVEWTGTGYKNPEEKGLFVCPRATAKRMMWAAWRDRAALSAAS